MELNNVKKGLCTLKLNSISKVEDDPLLIKTTFSILDFNCSGNGDIVSKEIAIEASPTLKGKPLLAVYSPNTNTVDEPNDHLNDHGEQEKNDRYGNEYIGTNSIAIGTALEEGYITTITNEDGNEEEVLACDFYLWADRNVEILQLINEIHEQGIDLYSSCEYYFSNYEMNDGIRIIKSPLVFSGHCCLGSGENNSKKVPPAYDSSKMISFNKKLNKAIYNQLNNKSENNGSDLNIKNNKMEGDNMAEPTKMFKKNCELSFDDIRSQIYMNLKDIMSEDEYYDSYITECYNDYFVLSCWNDSSHKYFKINYTKNDTSVSINYEDKAEVQLYQEWKEIPEVQNCLNEKEEELTKANEKATELEKQLNEKEKTIKSLNEKINSTNTEKTEIETKFNDVTDKLTSLNSMVENMKPIVDEYNKEQFEKELNEMKSTYEKKFNSVNALEKFETDEVQELIKKALNKNEDGKNAIISLNKMVVDAITFDEEIEREVEAKPIKELCSRQENLIPNDSFEARYGF
ncbi:coiled-coil domain-containing protein [Clostridium sporogenes]|uniref:coiled-coil domain-containing protein n=1 Tax=Clostridium sporogenes TaxID=1509 RepID=UPI0013D5C7E6|nr:hypothetical protein [Clostridium sporogenes]NFH40689.1 hypothetical protein [Clostridium sporogenes]